MRLHRKIAEEMERAWGERAASHAAEVAFHFWRGAAASGAERGADYAIAAADNAEAAYAHDEVVAFLRIALELIPANDPRRPRLLARLGLRSDLDARWRRSGQGGDGGGDTDRRRPKAPMPRPNIFEAAAREMLRRGLMSSAWNLAREGLRYIGERRDMVWASLDEIDTFRCRRRGIRQSRHHH